MDSTQIKPFVFMSSVESVQLTGLKASSLLELFEGLQQMDDSSIYYHTYRFHRLHSFLNSRIQSDFAWWIGENLKELVLAERIQSMDLRQYHSLAEFRQNLMNLLEPLASQEDRWTRHVPSGLEFYFCRATSIVLETGYEAYNLEDFLHGLLQIDLSSIHYHLIEAPLRITASFQFKNDFSNWLSQSLHLDPIAQALEALDPYRSNLETLRQDLLRLFKKETLKHMTQRILARLPRDPQGQAITAQWLQSWRRES
jgi:hypothetical protein